MKGKFPRLGIVGLCLTLAHHGLAAAADQNPAGVKVPHGPQTRPPTHDADALGAFILPVTDIDGLALEPALNQLKKAYEATCQQTGETPLTPSFDIPPGTTKPLHIRLPAGDFLTSVLVLSSLSGMNLERDGAEFRFFPISGRARIHQTLQVAPNFSSILQQMTRNANRRPIAELLGDLGLMPDPLASVTLNGAGELSLNEMRTADAQAISDFAKTLNSGTPSQLKFTVKVLEGAKSAQGITPKTDTLTDARVMELEARASGKKGVNFTTLPAVTALIGDEASIEMVRDFPPEDQLKEGETSTPVGKVARFAGNLIGLKRDVKIYYIDTVGSISPTTKKPEIEPHAKFEEQALISDGTTKLLTQTHADGSKTVLLVKAELIDATGRPFRRSR